MHTTSVITVPSSPLCNNSSTDADCTFPGPNYWSLFLIPLPIATILGNTLVVLAVLTERGLQSPTNFLLVSLATADLLVGTVVQPFSIYLAVNNLHWHLPSSLCHVFNVADVAASTASIVNLVAVSIDRFLAVVRHVEYRAAQHNKRLLTTVGFVWFFSMALALPLGTGLNKWDPMDHSCGINNLDYIFYGSIFAFYIPCLVMVVMYSVVFYQLHKRMRAIRMQEIAAGHMVNFGANLNNVVMTAHGNNQEDIRRNTLAWALPFIKDLEENSVDEDDVSSDDLQELTTILATLETDSHKVTSGFHKVTNDEINEADEEDQFGRRSASLSGGRPQSSLSAIERERLSSYTTQNNDDMIPEADNDQDAQQTNGGCSKQQTGTGRENGSSGSLLGPNDFSFEVPLTRRSTQRKHKRRLSQIQRNFANHKNRYGVGNNSSNSTTPLNSCSSNSNNNALPSKNNSLTIPGSATAEFERRRSSVFFRGGRKVKSLKERAIELLMKIRHKEGQQVRKESRATKLVTAVLGVFLMCWLPFFTLNMVKAFRLQAGDWNPHLEILFSFFTWLGYLNSCLNPVIYSLINKKFRVKFRKILHCAEPPQNKRGYQRQSGGRGSPQKLALAPMLSLVVSREFASVNNCNDV